MDSLFFGGYDAAIDICKKRLSSGEITKVFTPNAEMLSAAHNDVKLRKLLSEGDLLIPDGIGVYLGGKILKKSPFERTNGIDFAEILINQFPDKPLFLLGTSEQNVKNAATNIKAKYGANVVGSNHGFFKKSGEENRAVIEKINSSGAEILFVCMGFPLQEKWICENISKLKTVKLAIGLGGSIDVWSGRVERAPIFFRRIGAEWIFRAFYSPDRIKRLPSLFNFGFLCLKKAHFL